MATQLAEAPADDGGNDNGAIDYETEARKLGWSDADSFKGDPTKHVDAETFYKRGQEVMPILKAQNKALMKRLDALEKDKARSADFFSKAAERAYEQGIADVKRQMADAVESGDTKAANEAIDALSKLEKPTAVAKPNEDDQEQRAEEFADWMKANKWYGDNDAFRAYADAQADKIIKAKGGGNLDLTDLGEIANRVKSKFEDAYPEIFGEAAKPKPRSAVDNGGNAPARRGGRTFGDLPPEAQRMCDKWVANGTIKSREDYVRGYDFGDKK